MTRINLVRATGLAAVAGLVLACATSYPARRTDDYGFLADYQRLHKGRKDQAERVYIAPDVDWKTYDKILLDPVTIWRGTESRSRGTSHANTQQLANYFYQLVYNELSQHWKLVDTPGPGTLRVAVAITKLDEESVVLDVISSVVPQVRALDNLQSFATGRFAFTGSAAVEARMTDAETGRIIAEGADRRIGRHILNAKQLQRWGDVQEIMEFWVERSVHNLCTVQGRPDCPPLPKGA